MYVLIKRIQQPENWVRVQVHIDLIEMIGREFMMRKVIRPPMEYSTHDGQCSTLYYLPISKCFRSAIFPTELLCRSVFQYRHFLIHSQYLYLSLSLPLPLSLYLCVLVTFFPSTRFSGISKRNPNCWNCSFTCFQCILFELFAQNHSKDTHIYKLFFRYLYF